MEMSRAFLDFFEIIGGEGVKARISGMKGGGQSQTSGERELERLGHVPFLDRLLSDFLIITRSLLN